MENQTLPMTPTPFASRSFAAFPACGEQSFGFPGVDHVRRHGPFPEAHLLSLPVTCRLVTPRAFAHSNRWGAHAVTFYGATNSGVTRHAQPRLRGTTPSEASHRSLVARSLAFTVQATGVTS